LTVHGSRPPAVDCKTESDPELPFEVS